MTELLEDPAVRDRVRFGTAVRDWRKVRGLTAEMVAARAGITRVTLRAIERGEGGVQLGNVFAVLAVLGISGLVAEAADPLSTEIGRVRWANTERQRVR